MANTPIIGSDGPDILTGDNPTPGDDTIFGNGGNDTLSGLSGNDVLVGGPGMDTLTGGSGADIFRDTAANFNGDRITDMQPGDRIQLTDLSLASHVTVNGSNVTYDLPGGGQGSIALDNVGPGRFVIRGITTGGVELRLQESAHNDFSGSGLSGILWRSDNGTVSDWLGQLNGGFVGNSAHDINGVPSSWRVAGSGDFNGDGRVDVLWRNDNGTVSDWLGQSNGSLVGNSAHDVVVPNSWQIAATGDFNGDGRADILWRNSDGTISDWLGQADGSFAGNSPHDVNVPSNWHVVGTGDFNGDGIDDILWRNDAGTISDWLGLPDGGFVGNAANDTNNVPTSWHIVGTGDFNGDGRADILWRNDNGTVSDWLGQANGGFVGNSAHDVIVPSTWHIVGIGDFNGDAVDDLLWRNDSGTVSDWLGQSNGAFAGNSAHDVNVPTNWHIQDSFVHDPFALPF